VLNFKNQHITFVRECLAAYTVADNVSCWLGGVAAVSVASGGSCSWWHLAKPVPSAGPGIRQSCQPLNNTAWQLKTLQRMQKQQQQQLPVPRCVLALLLQQAQVTLLLTWWVNLEQWRAAAWARSSGPGLTAS
jgi:hypothetical protein